jgi:hypothetical protein
LGDVARLEPLNEIFKAATKFKNAVVDVIVAVHEESDVNYFSYAQGTLVFYPNGKPGLGSAPLFWSDQLRKFHNVDEYKNSKGISCPFDGETEQISPYEVMIAEKTYYTVQLIDPLPGLVQKYTGKKLGGGDKPKFLEETHTLYHVRIQGLAHIPAVEFEPNYEPNSRILTAIVDGLTYSKFVTISLCNLREGTIY